MFECTGKVFQKSTVLNVVAFIAADEGQLIIYDLNKRSEQVVDKNVAAFVLDGSNIAYVNNDNKVFYQKIGANLQSTSFQIQKANNKVYHLMTVMKHALILSGFAKVNGQVSRYITLVDKRFMTLITEYVEASTAGRLA